MSEDGEKEKEDVLIPLAEHRRPSRPTTNELKAWVKKAFLLFRKNDGEPFIANDKLHRTAASLLDKIASPPAFGTLSDGLEKSLRAWFAADSPGKRVRVIVVPPGDARGLVAAWAEECGHEMLRAPAREDIATGLGQVPDLAGEGILVIPHLEHWFFRSQRGLATVRALLEAMDQCGREMVVSCDSWAWAFLSKAAALDLILPDEQTLRPFDGDQLAAWFSNLVAQSGMESLRFRESESGKDLLKKEDGPEVEGGKSDFFRELAARSRGIPWVAWSLWRSSIRLEQEEKKEDGGEAGNDGKMYKGKDPLAGRKVLWVASLEEFSLPNAHRETGLLVLHALLLHGALSREQICGLVPLKGAGEMLPALLRSGFIEERDGILSCGAAAYPSVRSGLTTAGFSMDKL